MSIAYNILAHKNPRQVIRLVQAIYSPNNQYLIHWDKKSGDLDLQSIRDELPEKNILFQKRRSIQWGGQNMLLAQLDAITRVLALKKDWTHYVNLSGQDFPIKSNTEIEGFLSENKRTSYVNSFDPDKQKLWSNHPQRVTRYYIELNILQKVLHLPLLGRRFRRILHCNDSLPYLPFARRRYPLPFKLYGGSNFVALNRKACEYLTQSQQAKKILNTLRHSLQPEETFFQTALLNGPLSNNVANDNKRFIKWKLNSPHPLDLNESHLTELRNSNNLFARKFKYSTKCRIFEAFRPSTGGCA